MPIDKKLFEKEAKTLISKIKEGSSLARDKEYEKAVNCFSDAIISAGLILQKDQAVGRKLKLDKVILVIKGYQLKAYMEKLSASGNAGKSEILEKMEEIARGPISFENEYFGKISRAMDEYEGYLR